MKKYHVAFAIAPFGNQHIYKEFGGIIPAHSRDSAIKTAKAIFAKEHPIYSAHFLLLWCNEVLY